MVALVFLDLIHFPLKKCLPREEDEGGQLGTGSSSYNYYNMIQLSEHHNEPHQYTTRAVGQHLLLLAALIRRSSGENLF